MKRSNPITAGLAVAILLGLAACGGDVKSDSSSAGASSGSTSSASKGCAAPTIVSEKAWNAGGQKTFPDVDPAQVKGKKIAFIGFGKDNPWSEWMFKAVQCEAKEHGASADFVGPPSFDGQAQFQLVSDLATSKTYDAIVIVPNDSPSIGPAVKQAVAAGIPVVAVSQPIGPDVLSKKMQVAGLVGQVVEDLTINASAMADGVVKSCEGTDPCQVGVLWGARSLAFDKVKPKIFESVIKQHPNIKVVCQTDAGYTQDQGRTQSADCLQAHPKLNVYASQADESTRGAEASITAAGRTFGPGKDDIKLVSAYASFYGVKQVAAGKWVQTSYNRPQSMGRAGARLALMAIAGQEIPAGLRYVVQDTDLDGVGTIVTRDVLEQHPEVKGQWEG